MEKELELRLQDVVWMSAFERNVGWGTNLTAIWGFEDD